MRLKRSSKYLASTKQNVNIFDIAYDNMTNSINLPACNL